VERPITDGVARRGKAGGGGPSLGTLGLNLRRGPAQHVDVGREAPATGVDPIPRPSRHRWEQLWMYGTAHSSC